MVVAICFANSCSTYTHTYIYTVRWTNTLNKPTDWRKTLKYPTHKSPQTYTCNGQYTNTSTSSIVLSTWIMCHCPHRKHEQLVKPSSMTEFLGIQRLYIYSGEYWVYSGYIYMRAPVCWALSNVAKTWKEEAGQPLSSKTTPKQWTEQL